MIDATMPTIIAMPVVSELTPRRSPRPATAAGPDVVPGPGPAGGPPVRRSDSAGRADGISAQSDDG